MTADLTRVRLMRDVLDHPEDVAPRLVLADHLIEHGDAARGELIVAECELANQPAGARRTELARRIEALAPARDAAWRAELGGCAHHLWYERGLPVRATLRLGGFPEALARILELAPIRIVRIAAFTLTVDEAAMRTIANLPALDRIDGIELVNFFDRRNADLPLLQLLEAPCRLMHLRSFAVTETRLATSTLRRIGHLPWQRLERLDLSGAFHDEAGLVALLEGPGLARLRWLGMVFASVGDRGAAALAAAVQLTELDTLSIHDVTPAGLAMLVRAPHLQRLSALRIQRATLGVAGARSLADAAMPELRELVLAHTALTDEGVAAIAAAPGLAKLDLLDLGGNAITDEGARALLDSPVLATLSRLSLKANPAISKSMQSKLRARFGTGVCTFSR